MNVKNVFFFLQVLGLISCDKQNIRCYKFENMVVTRIDYNNKSIFHYGYCNWKKKLCDSTKTFDVEYNFRGGIDLYLVFKKNDKKIGIIDHGLGITTISNPDLFYKMNIKNPHYKVTVEKMMQDSSIGIIRISNNRDLEEKWYNEEKSRVSYEECP